MLASDHRLRRSSDFRRALRQGRRVTSRTLILHAAPATPLAATPAQKTRVGLAVNRSVGGAVVRNRVKRRLRAAAETQLEALDQSGPWDIVVRATPRAATAGFDELSADLAKTVAGLVAPSSAARPGLSAGKPVPA